VLAVTLLICWLVVVPTVVVLLRLRRARYAEPVTFAAPAPRACEYRRRPASAVRARHLLS
jgi:hypothetical protein